MRFGETMAMGYGLEVEDFVRRKSGKGGRFRGRHHVGGAWGS
jgi:hypothetical protein